jgi:hypothetical protein
MRRKDTLDETVMDDAVDDAVSLQVPCLLVDSQGKVKRNDT